MSCGQGMSQALPLAWAHSSCRPGILPYYFPYHSLLLLSTTVGQDTSLFKSLQG